MGISIGILIICFAIYICNLVMLNKTFDALNELKEIKQCLQTMRSYMRNWR